MYVCLHSVLIDHFLFLYICMCAAVIDIMLTLNLTMFHPVIEILTYFAELVIRVFILPSSPVWSPSFQIMKAATSTIAQGVKGVIALLPPNARESSLRWARSSNRGDGGRRKAVRSFRKLQKVLSRCLSPL